MVLSYSQSCLRFVGLSTKSLNSILIMIKRIGIKIRIRKKTKIRSETNREIEKRREILRMMTEREIKIRIETRTGTDKGKQRGKDNKSWKIMKLLIPEGLFRNITIVNMISLSSELFLN